MVKLREHRGGLDESLQTTILIEPTMEALLKVINKRLKPFGRSISENDVEVYYYTYDKRIGWDTYIVIVKRYGCFGYTDGPIPAKTRSDHFKKHYLNEPAVPSDRETQKAIEAQEAGRKERHGTERKHSR